MNPEFSVVIPTYNRGLILARCLDSLVRQTFKNFEVIISDDGSTDNTDEIVDLFKDKLCIQYLRNKHWGGAARPRNIGIKAARAGWICFLDSDDWWYPEKLSICRNYTDRFNLIYHDLDMYNDPGKATIGKLKSRKLGKNVFLDLLNNGNSIGNSSVVVKKELLERVGGISEERELLLYQDYDCWLRIAGIEDRFHYVSKSLGAYWIDTDRPVNWEKISTAMEHLRKKYIEALRDEDKKNYNRRLLYQLGKVHENLHEEKKAIDYYKISIKSNSLKLKFNSVFRLLFAYLKLRF